MQGGDWADDHPVIAEGREAVIHDWGHGLVLRLMRSPDAGPAVTRSAAASEAARNAGVPTPRVVDLVEVDGHPAQVLERVDGPDLFAHVAANPLRLPRAATTLAQVHAALHEVTAPRELPPTHEHLAGRIETSPLVPAAVKSRALDLLGGLPHGDVICHGDYHPGNLLLTDAGPVLIDWTSATRGDPTADFAYTRVMLRVGELPPGALAVVRVLSRTGRSAVWRLYDRGYRRMHPVEPELLERWTVLAAANKLTDGIDAERAGLLAMIRQLPQ